MASSGDGSGGKAAPVTRPKAQPVNPQLQQQYLTDLVHSGLDRVSIGGFIFWINPDLKYHTERFYTEVPTLGTWGFYDWGVQPYEFTLTGTTGTAGLHNLDTDDNSMRTIRPLFKTSPALVDFRYPNRFPGARKVRVLMIEDSYTSQNKFYWYTITLKEYPSSQTAYAKVSTTSAPSEAQSGKQLNGAVRIT